MPYTKIVTGNCLETIKILPECSINCCITSPPYFNLRDYNIEGQMGLENSPEEFTAKMVEVFREVRRVLKKDGTLWLNLGDSYYNYRPGKGQKICKQTVSKTNQDLPQSCPRRAQKFDSVKEKDLFGIPWRVALALQADGWYLRQDIIWNKPNPMPESVKDRCTKSHEYIFLLSKSQNYFFDSESILEPAVTGDDKEMRNKRSVWTVPTKPFKGAHFATFPENLIKPCVLAGCPEKGLILDPFGGAGTTGLVANQNNRNAILCELNPTYVEMAKKRLSVIGLNAEIVV